MMIFVIIPLLTFKFGRYLDYVLEIPPYPAIPWNIFIGFGVFYFGLSLGIKSTRLLYDIGGGLPWGEAVEEVKTTKLVTTGAYKYIRNPMVLGYSLLPLGMGVMFQSPGMALSIFPVVLFLNMAIVKLKEEPDLRRRFGKKYEIYRKSTPFLIPRPRRIYDEIIRVTLKSKKIQIIYVTFSLLGLLILSQLFFKEPNSMIYFPHQSVIFLGLFTTICVIGLIAAVCPNRLRISSHKSGNNPEILGHHPDCVNFNSHIIHLKNKASCAGCTGLAMGSILAILGTGFYFFSGATPFNMEITFWLGALMVTLGLLQHFIDLGIPLIHLLLNIVFVYGASLIVVSVELVEADIFTYLYTLAITLFWISARIRISQEEHIGICNSCPKQCEKGFKTYPAQ